MTKKLLGSLELNRIYQMDCLEGMRMIPDKSVDLIIADPPYYKIKGDFDFKWRTMSEYLEWCAAWLKECERVLSPQGSLYVYGMELQLEYLAVKIADTTSLEYRNRITLNKQQSYIKDLYGSQEHFRRFIPSAEFLLFYTFKDETGLKKAYNHENFSAIGDYFKTERIKSGLSKSECDKVMGVKSSYYIWENTKIDEHHTVRIPRIELYEKLQSTGYWQRPYEELKSQYELLRKQYESLRQVYEDQRYTFNAKDGMTNVWEFEPDRGKLKTKHPTQKPLALCERIVSVSSNDGDTVLIPFVGSGSECVAAARLKRNFIGFELETDYVKIANQRLEAVQDERAEMKLTE